MSNWKVYLKSAAITFVATFALAILPVISDHSFVWTKAALVALGGAALRTALKAVIEFIQTKVNVKSIL